MNAPTLRELLLQAAAAAERERLERQRVDRHNAEKQRLHRERMRQRAKPEGADHD